ncbi:uncharacterized protein LOC144301131 isoform X3 [Canis aureus]
MSWFSAYKRKATCKLWVLAVQDFQRLKVQLESRRKITEMKCHFNYIILRIPTTNMTIIADVDRDHLLVTMWFLCPDWIQTDTVPDFSTSQSRGLIVCRILMNNSLAFHHFMTWNKACGRCSEYWRESTLPSWNLSSREC